MKPFYLIFLLLFCLVEIYGQRSRTTTTIQNPEASKNDTKSTNVIRSRGRTRFSVTTETTASPSEHYTRSSPVSSAAATTNRRASTRTRIHSNNPVAERRAKVGSTTTTSTSTTSTTTSSTTIDPPSRSYAVEEVNNDSPIDSFRRQSKSRVLTETKFEAVPKESNLRSSPSPPIINVPPIEEFTKDFGSTARAILQARGETVPPKTTSPKVDEEYLRNNFGSGIRSLAATRGGAGGSTKAADGNDDEFTPYRSSFFDNKYQSSQSEPYYGASFGIDTDLAKTVEAVRNEAHAKLAQARAKAKNKNDDAPAEETAKINDKEAVQEQSQTAPDETASEKPAILIAFVENAEANAEKSPAADVPTYPKPFEAATVERRKIAVNGRRNQIQASTEGQPSATLRRRKRIRVKQQPTAAAAVDSEATASVITAYRRSYVVDNDDADVAESRGRAPTVFMLEPPQEFPSRSRSGRKIAATNLQSTGSRTRSRPVTEASPTTIRSQSRGRSRSGVVAAPIEQSSRPSPRSRYNPDEDYVGRTKETKITDRSRSRQSNRGRSGRVEEPQPRNAERRNNFPEQSQRRNAVIDETPRRRSSISDENLSFGSRSFARSSPTDSSTSASTSSTSTIASTTTTTTTTTTTERTTNSAITNGRSRSRFSDAILKVDEAKLEILPLFEREVKPVTRSRGQRARLYPNRQNSLVHDQMLVSATEDNVKFIEKPTTAFTRMSVSRTESVEISTSRSRLSTRSSTTPVTITTTTSTTATTAAPKQPKSTSSIQRKKIVSRSQPIVKESVVTEFNEVTSKSTITRRKKLPKPSNPSAAVAPILLRGTKKSEIKLNSVGKDNQKDEVDDEDNYPAAFKALLQSKKKKEEVPRSSLKSSSSAAAAASATRGASTSTEKVIVTPLPSFRGSSSSTSRLVPLITTTTAPSVVIGRRPSVVRDFIMDTENELDPKPTVAASPIRSNRTRPLPKPSDRPKYQYKPKPQKSIPVQEKHTNPDTKTTNFSRKPYIPKSYSPKTSKTTQQQHFRRKTLRSTAWPPSTTPTPNVVGKESRFSAKFVQKQSKINENEEIDDLTTTGASVEDVEENASKKSSVVPGALAKKIQNNRFSARYRSDLQLKNVVLKSTTAKPFYVPTIPTPAYLPTVPTIRPSTIPSVDQMGYVVEKDIDLGLEVISFDDPVNTIPSANLVNGEYLTTDRNIKISPMVKDGTTEKTVSIIERIINSITSISTTTPPDPNTVNASASINRPPPESSAILKLAPVKKSTVTKDKTIRKLDNTDNNKSKLLTVTSEKPTTIIEKILSSLTAIQSNEVGTPPLDVNHNVSSTSSSSTTTSSFSPSTTTIITTTTTPIITTTPLSTVTKYSAKFRGSTLGTTALPAPLPLSTSINSIDENEVQIESHNTIGKLLEILNGMVSSTETNSNGNVVLVTPKTSLTTTFPIQEPLEAVHVNEINSSSEFSNSIDSTLTTTIPSTNESVTDSHNTETTTLFNRGTTQTAVQTSDTPTTTPMSVDITTQQELATSESITQITSTREIPTTEKLASETTTVNSDSTVSTMAGEKTETPSTTTTTTTVESTANFYSTPFVLPTVPTFEVSPDSVHIISANDLLSNFVTPDDDNLFNTVTIASRGGLENNILTSTTTTSTSPTTITTEIMATSTLVPSTTQVTESSEITTTMMESTTPSGTTEGTEAITMTMPSADSTIGTTTEPISTTIEAVSNSTTLNQITVAPLTTIKPSANNSSNNLVRTGKILSTDDLGAPIGNSIEISSTPSTTTSTTPDYFIFAILNNNTILRKRPPTVPNKDVPFVIVGLYPNNTVVRKYPNGTLIPMDQVIKVRGFDTRPNPPPLIEITSNQVTDTVTTTTTSNYGLTTTIRNNNQSMIDSTRMGRLLDNEQSLSSSTSSSTTTTTTTIVPEQSMLSFDTNPNNNLLSMSSIVDAIDSSTVKTTNTPPSPPSTTQAQVIRISAIPSVQILAVPGETRVSKAQTTTETFVTTEPTASSTTTTVGSITTQIPPNLGEILNGKTVNAFSNLISGGDLLSTTTSTQKPNYKTLAISQSTTLVPSTSTSVPFTENQAQYTTSIFSNTDRTTQFPITTTTTTTTTDMPRPVFISTAVPSTSTIITSTVPTTTFSPPTTTTASTTTMTSPTTTTTTASTATTSTLRTTTVPKIVTTKRAAKKQQTKPPPLPRPSSTILPTIFNTLFPNIMRGVFGAVANPPNHSSTSNRVPEFTNGFDILSGASTTVRPTTVLPPSSTSPKISTTTTTTPVPTTTTRRTTTTTTTTTTTRPTTTSTTPPTTITTTTTRKPSVATAAPKDTDALFNNLKKSGRLQNLNEEQKKNLEEIERIEKEQSELLKQLNILSRMFGGGQNAMMPIKAANVVPRSGPVTESGGSLANRIINLAIERENSKTSINPAPLPSPTTTTTSSTTTTTTTTTTTSKPTTTPTKRPNSIQDKLPVTEPQGTTQRTTPSLDDVLRQYNLNGFSTSTPITAAYGKTNEALLAALLKEQGIGPTTPKTLADRVKEAGLFDEATKKPRTKSRPSVVATTSARPTGRLMQGLNWLLDVLDPPSTTTRKPASRKTKSKKKPKPRPNQIENEELLTNQPTKITPIVTAAPVTKPNLSPEEIQVLIKQLETIQNDPNGARQLDLSKIKSLHDLINVNEGVEVKSAGQHGATTRSKSRLPQKISVTTEKTTRNKKSSTLSTLSVSNSIDEDDDDGGFGYVPTTRRTRVMPPVSLNPIPGIDDGGGGGDTFIRSNLLTAAVNVTRAISSFLGSALQGASRGFRSLINSGGSMVGNLAQSSGAAGSLGR